MAVNIRPIKNKVLVTELEFGITKTEGGIIIPDDDGKLHGIKSRWGKVYKVGSDVKDLESGDYVLVKHGRWTRGINIETNDGNLKIFMIDYPDAVLLVSKERPKILNQLHKTFSSLTD